MSDEILVMLERLARLPTLAEWRAIATRYYQENHATPLPGDLDVWWQEEISASRMMGAVGTLAGLGWPGSSVMLAKLALVCARSCPLAPPAVDYLDRLDLFLQAKEVSDLEKQLLENRNTLHYLQSEMLELVHDCTVTRISYSVAHLAKGITQKAAYIVARRQLGPEYDAHQALMARLIREAQPTAPRRYRVSEARALGLIEDK